MVEVSVRRTEPGDAESLSRVLAGPRAVYGMRAGLELADGWISLTRIELHVHTDNERAISLYERFGFVVEGTHRSFALRVDAFSMARLMP